MNIKIVYNTKTHKISQKHQTLDEIKKAILLLYPQQLDQGFDLYISLHLEMNPFRISDEATFLKIKQLYNQQKWSSIKILVKDFNNPNLTNDDLSVLNQSVLAQPSDQLQTFVDLFQQPQQPKQEEIHKQNIVNKEIVPEPNLTQEIIKQIDKHEFQGINYHSEEFKQFIIEQIDERLKYHGILQKNIDKPKVPQFKMQFKTKNLQIQKYINEYFQWEVEIINTGDAIWKRNHIALVGINGIYSGIKFELYNDIYPGQTVKFVCSLQMPKYQIQNNLNEFQLANYQQNQVKPFGDKIQLTINTLQIQQQKPCLKNNNKEQKVKQFMENCSVPREKALQFIEMYGNDDPIEEIILAYFDQPK